MEPKTNTYIQPEAEAKAVADLTVKLAETETVKLSRGDVDEASILLVADGRKPVSMKPFLDEYRSKPERMRGSALLGALESFVDHVNRFKDDDSAVFANIGRGTAELLGVLDYHRKGPKDDGARFGEHRARYQFPISDEWKAWTAQRAPMPQQEFAEFLEERLPDVMDPAEAGESARKLAAQLGITLATPQRLLELSRGLTVHVGHNVRTALNLSSGEAQLHFEEQHKTAEGGQLVVPGGFVVAIPVFRLGVRYQLPVRLRYRVQGGAVVWIVSAQRAEAAWDDAVKTSCEEVKAKTKLPLFYGTPES